MDKFLVPARGAFMSLSHTLLTTRLPFLLFLGALGVGGGGPPAVPILAQSSDEDPASRKPVQKPQRGAAQEPVEIVPRSGGGGGPIPVEPGEAHLISLLQYLA